MAPQNPYAYCQKVFFNLLFLISSNSQSDLTANTVGDYIYVIGGCSTNQICPPGADYCYCQKITNVTEAYHPVSQPLYTITNRDSLPTAGPLSLRLLVLATVTALLLWVTSSISSVDVT